MRLQLSKLLYNSGMRTMTDFYNPRISAFDILSLPKNSMYHNKDSMPNLADPVISKLIRPVGYIAEEITNQTITPYRKSNITVAKIFSNYSETGNKIEYYRKPNKLLSVPATRDVLIDYSALSLLYRYSPSKNKRLSELQNPYRTMLESINDSRYGSRIDFFSLPIPIMLPRYDALIKALRYNDYKILNIIDESFYPHYELLKYLFEKYRNDSVYAAIASYKINPCYILITGSTGYTILEPNKLFAMSKETDIVISGFEKRDPKLLVKYYLNYLVKILVSTTSLNIQNDNLKSQVSDNGSPNIEDIDNLIDAINNRSKNIEPVKATAIERITISKTENPKEVSVTTLTILKESGLGNDNRFKEFIPILEENTKEYESLKLTPEERKIKPVEIPLTVTIDKELTKEVSTHSKREYIKHYLQRHIKRSILAISKAGIPVTGVEEEDISNLSNRRKTYKINIKQPVGNPITLTVHVPIPDENGIYRVNGTEYSMSRQRLDSPIKKTKPAEVVLSSFYGKLFLRKAELSNSNASTYIEKILTKLAGTPNSPFNLYVTGSNVVYDVKLPTEYEVISRTTRSFVYKGIMFLFSYYERSSLLLGDTKLKDVERLGVLVGNDNKTHYIINGDNHLLTVDSSGKKIKDYGDFYNFLELKDLPIEYVTTKIKGVRLPIAILLMYFIGLTNILERFGIKHDFKDNKRDLTETDLIFKFLDGYLGVNIDNPYSRLIVGSLKLYEKVLKDVNYRLIDSRDTIKDILSLSGVDVKVVNSFIPLRTLFIDPITEEALLEMHEPTDFIELVIRGCELLENDYLKNPNSIDTFVIRGDDRLAGMVYNALGKAISQYYGKLGRVRTKLTVDPYTIYQNLSADATFSLKEDINPIESIRQDDELTLMGMFGRSRDTITNKDRKYHPSMVGIISEATKDNQNVGVTNYLSAVPNLKSFTGILESPDEIKPANVFSLSALVAPDITRDDGKRALYTSIQNKHIVATTGSIVSPYRTEAESVIPYRVNKSYALHADRPGKVISVTDKKVVIKYDNGTETYKLSEWIGRDTGGKTYRHIQKTLLKAGDTVEIGDNIYYDYLYFGEDLFNRKRVAYKSGVLTYVCQTEAEDSFEDASNMSKYLAKKMVTPVTYVKTKILPMNITIENIKSLRDKVKYSDNLITYRAGDDTDIGRLTEYGREILEEISSNTVRAEVKGEVVSIEVYYNPPDDNSDIVANKTVLKLIENTDKHMMERYGLKGEVDNTFSVKGKGIPPGFFYIKFFIEKMLPIGTTDKYRLANQLKSTVANVYDEIVTESGRPIGIEFGKRGIEARIVDSPYIQGTVNMILDKIEKDFLSDLGL